MKIALFAITLLLAATGLRAEDTRQDSSPLLLSDPVLGVEVRLADNGQLLSATSSYSHPVDFPDRRGINKAYIVAEEKAKAQLVRFMSQDVSTHRVVSEVDQAAEKASRSRTDDRSSWSKDVARTAQESLTETSSSLAHGTLNGDRILSRAYDEAGEQVTVVVGINQKSLKAAAQIAHQPESPAPYSAVDSFPGLRSEVVVVTDFQEF